MLELTQKNNCVMVSVRNTIPLKLTRCFPNSSMVMQVCVSDFLKPETGTRGAVWGSIL